MTQEEIIPICPICQSQLEKKEGKYGQFWGCPNFRECGFRGQKIKGQPKPDLIKPQTSSRDMILLDKLENIEKGMREIWKMLLIIKDKK